ncbi:protein of unknown function DUF559 [Thiothrix nivea DSM 5205]|uniref:DUF559 domain-containing protein n=1 Tax=Thiothrix nivea (strain ATCC 35100 / DSM 5205 / JP2) TaxID=870187 RepID=A0A656HDK2_THINJ|nr:DUF559 domain-containing protein [Thiothrix nivea]EIJ34487.1 protein of unknown function DUF559 [Thiothrix nivea DSM 5205]
MRHTQRYQALPYNPKLKERAKELRRAGNLSEVLLWNQLKRGQFKGLDFDRQKIIGNFIVDFYCAEKHTVLEVDGSSHDDKADYDAERDAYLSGLGLNVIRIRDKDVKQNLAAVTAFLLHHPAFEDNHPTPSGHPSTGGESRQHHSPPMEGWTAKLDGVVLPPLEGAAKLDRGSQTLSPITKRF